MMFVFEKQSGENVDPMYLYVLYKVEYVARYDIYTTYIRHPGRWVVAGTVQYVVVHVEVSPCICSLSPKNRRCFLFVRGH